MTDLDTRRPHLQPYDLGDRYRSGSGAVVLTGVHAIARALVEQHVRDTRAGRRVATFISGYQGSPLGGVDRMLAGELYTSYAIELPDRYEYVTRRHCAEMGIEPGALRAQAAGNLRTLRPEHVLAAVCGVDGAERPRDACRDEADLAVEDTEGMHLGERPPSSRMAQWASFIVPFIAAYAV